MLKFRKTQAIVGAKAANSSILVELLTAQEALGTKLTVSNNIQNDKLQAFQAFVLDIGPALDATKTGFKVGDRIALSGGFVPLPNYLHGERQVGIIEVSAVKAILEEASEE